MIVGLLADNESDLGIIDEMSKWGSRRKRPTLKVIALHDCAMNPLPSPNRVVVIKTSCRPRQVLPAMRLSKYSRKKWGISQNWLLWPKGYQMRM